MKERRIEVTTKSNAAARFPTSLVRKGGPSLPKSEAPAAVHPDPEPAVNLRPKAEGLYKAVRTTRLYEQIVEQIEESILKGLLKAGDQLPAERELALQFGVSRTAVREAVKALREKGLVDAQPGRGTFITSGNPQAMRQSLCYIVRAGHPEGTQQLAEVRAMLEPEIAALAATRIGETHLAMMRDAIGVMDRSKNAPEAFIEADLDFHLALAEAAANPIILTLIDSIVGLLREQRLKIFYVEGGPDRGQFHHKRILEAVERHDADAARQAMRAHLEQIRKDCSPPVKTKRRGDVVRHG